MAASRSIGRRTELLLKGAAAQFSNILGSRAVRYIIILLSVSAAVYLIFLNGWQPLHTKVGLPPGVGTEDLQLDAALLKEINVQRVSRQQHTLYTYGSENGLFVPLPSVAP